MAEIVRLILLCLLLPTIFAQPHKTKDPNDKPFLPIHPVYPYSPKLIKRGAEAESTSQLMSELYAPKIDAKDSYSSSYNNNHQKISYYSHYDSYSKNNSPSSAHSSYYNNDAYPYANLPYVIYNPYSTQYTVNPALYPPPSYPNYYYQPPYYYPHYFNHAPLSPLPTPSSDIDQETLQDSTETSEKDKQSTQSKENETNQDASTSQFVDGNYISGNLKDLDGQSSTYKIASPYNQLDVQTKGLPIFLPKTTYRVISVAGQPVGPDYPLPAPYVKVQQMEQLMSQTLGNLLAQKQAGQSYENDKDILSSVNDGSYTNQGSYTPNTPSYSLSGAKTKTGVTYVINVDGAAKVNGERINLQKAPIQKTSNKNTRYSSVHYVQKPVSQTTYASSDNRIKHGDRVIDRRPTNQRDDYTNYDAHGQFGNKQEQNYRSYQNQSGPYQNKDFTAASQTPRSYNYEYSAYESDRAQQMKQDKISAERDDGNLGNKQYNKE